MSKKTKEPSTRDGPSKKTSRRALLATLGIGVVLPAVRAAGLEKSQADWDRDFEAYWAEIEKWVENRDNEKDPKAREKWELHIQYSRQTWMATLDKSNYSNCHRATPTPLPSKK